MTTTLPFQIEPAANPTLFMADDFETFWRCYPKKVAKGAARKAWDKARKKVQLPRVLSALAAQVRSAQWRKDGGQFIPYPSTWLNQERWEDEMECRAELRNQKPTQTAREKILEAAGRTAPNPKQPDARPASAIVPKTEQELRAFMAKCRKEAGV